MSTAPSPRFASWLACLNSGAVGYPDLGPGPRPGVESVAQLDQRLRPLQETLPAHSFALARALVLLWHDHHDEAHAVVQDQENPDGSLIHAILHRREPDYGNAQYWFRRVGSHPIYGTLADALHNQDWITTQTPEIVQCFAQGKWDAMQFVDVVARAAQKSDADTLHQEAVAVQDLESRILLQYLVE